MCCYVKISMLSLHFYANVVWQRRFYVFGAHRFYVGRAGSGAAMLIITLMLGWVFGIGLLITGIWGFIDLILILCGVFKDANEQKLK